MSRTVLASITLLGVAIAVGVGGGYWFARQYGDMAAVSYTHLTLPTKRIV